MDYEKKYNEALERAKAYHRNELAGSRREMTEYIFPELRESEDERIRKAVVSLVYEMKGTYQSFAKVELDKMVTWLEKQKEQKHPNGCFTCDEYKKGYEEGRRNGFTAGYNKAMKEVEQKEQKPWKVGANAYFTPEQKPAWSEEDEQRIAEIEFAVMQMNTQRVGTKDKCLAWLKSLRPVSKESLQPHWKPSDEQMNHLSAAVDAAIRKHNESVSGYKPARVLKSLYEDLQKL